MSVHGVTPPQVEVGWQEVALEIAGIGVWEWDFVKGKGQWSNGLSGLLGLCPDDTALGPDGLSQFVHPDDQTRYRNSIHACLEGHEDHNLEYRVVLADHSVRWFLDRARVLRNSEGDLRKMIGAITDVTERKLEEIAKRELENYAQGRLGAEQALVETEHRFKEILGYAPVAVYIKNLDGLLTFANKRFLDLFGVSEEEVILQDRSHVHPPEILDQLREHDRLVIEAGRALQFEEVIEIKGVRQTYLSVKFPLHDHDGKAYALCGISADITDRKQAEQVVNERSVALQSAIDEINQLTYSVSHEMGSPLRGVIGNIRFLREELGEKLEPEVDLRLNRVERAGLKMAQLVDDLLAYTRLSRLEMDVEELDFTDLAEQTLSKLMRDKSAYRDCIVEVEDDIKFEADSDMVNTALIALLENSFKYRKPGAITRIKIRGIENGFSLSDDGIGLDKQYAHKIFRPFERLHRDADFAGTGIGLAKVARIVERHGGKIWVESELGHGAQFFLQFGRAEL